MREYFYQPRAWTRGAALALLLACPAYPEDGPEEIVAFTKDVAPILFEHCVSCHRSGEVAPMSLRTYKEARPWAKAIKAALQKGDMPPWFANPAHGEFKNDPSLSQKEIDTIVRWVDQGARRGRRSDMPQMPDFVKGWQNGVPDYVVELPEVEVPADGPDIFPNLTIELDVPEDRWVRAVEIRPGNKEVSHHVVVFMNANRGGVGPSFDVLGVWAVGTPPNAYPEGMGRRIRAGQRLLANMHYHPSGKLATDRTRIGLYFGKNELKKEVNAVLVGSFTFEVPPGAPNHEVTGTWFVDQDIKVVSFFPHMHLRGKDMRFTATLPSGDQKVLLDVPKYDFDWQLFYYPVDPVSLPKGSRIDILAHYDNSAQNPDNPDPGRSVGFGLESTDEMMFGVFEYITDEGVRPRELSSEERVDHIVASLPNDDALYKVTFSLGATSLTTALVLPRKGKGTWYVPYQGQLVTLDIKEVEWVGDAFEFGISINAIGADGQLAVSGEMTEDGGIRGTLSTGVPPNSFSLANFTGDRP